MNKKTICIGIASLFLLLSTAIPTIGAGYNNPYNSIDKIVKEIREKPHTNVPPGTYNFEDVYFCMGTSYTKDIIQFSINGLPKFKGFIVNMLLSRKTLIMPKIFDLTKNTFKATAEYLMDDDNPDDKTVFYGTTIYKDSSNEEPLLEITGQKHKVILDYSFKTGEDSIALLGLSNDQPYKMLAILSYKCNTVTVTVE